MDLTFWAACLVVFLHHPYKSTTSHAITAFWSWVVNEAAEDFKVYLLKSQRQHSLVSVLLEGDPCHVGAVRLNCCSNSYIWIALHDGNIDIILARSAINPTWQSLCKNSLCKEDQLWTDQPGKPKQERNCDMTGTFTRCQWTREKWIKWVILLSGVN